MPVQMSQQISTLQKEVGGNLLSESEMTHYLYLPHLPDERLLDADVKIHCLKACVGTMMFHF